MTAGAGPGGDDAERARLERVAYGPDSDPRDAARARLALADLRSASARSTTPARPTTSARPTTPARPTPVARATAVAWTTDEPEERADGTPDTAAVESTASRDPRWYDGLRRLRRPGLTLGSAVLVLAAVAFGGGILVGQTRHPPSSVVAESAKDSADGELTLARFLAARQTFADQLPGAIRAPVRLHSTRLVFTNRSLSADDSQTPWDVYAAVGTDPSLICLVASPDGLTASESCAPREDALHGSITLVAQSSSGTLTIRVVAGVVTGSVAPTS